MSSGLYLAGLSRKHFVPAGESVSVLSQQAGLCVCVCVQSCVWWGTVAEEEAAAALGRWLKTPAGALQRLPDTMK